MIIALVIYYIHTQQAAAIQAQPVEFAQVVTVDYELTAPQAPRAINPLYVG